jgi:hypothetical protein
MGRACSTHGKKRTEHRVLVGKSEGKRAVARPRHRWDDKTEIDLREVGWGGVDWVHLVEDREQRQALVNTVMNIRVG